MQQSLSLYAAGSILDSIEEYAASHRQRTALYNLLGGHAPPFEMGFTSSVLAIAKQLLEQSATASIPDGPAAVEQPAVDAEMAIVIENMEAAYPRLLVYDNLNVSRQVAGRVVRALESSDFVERPSGIKKGFRLTATGLSLAAQLRRNLGVSRTV